ncbi:MAG: hypothetical protein ACW98D_08640 [Promethearchaeota archaeon]|jgi:hypothetical protein
MVISVFSIDWIFVDTVIIVLLILLLVGVKFFKSTHRWRLKFSNTSLEYYSFHKSQDQVKRKGLRTTLWDLTKNTSLQDKGTEDNVIIIIRTIFKKKLVRILTEGLSSYGFNVISIKINKKTNLDSQISKGNKIDELQSLVLSIINKSERKGLVANPNYILLNFSDLAFLGGAISLDSKNMGLIVLNPKMNKSNKGIQQEIYNSQQQESQFFYIFSGRSFFIFKNRNLKQYQNNFEERNAEKVELIILDKSNRNFKYYETILLGLLIDIIESRLIKSKYYN